MSENINSFLQIIEQIYKNIGNEITIEGINVNLDSKELSKNLENKTDRCNILEKCSFCQNRYIRNQIYFYINIHYDYSGTIEIVPFQEKIENLMRYPEINGLRNLVCKECTEIIKSKIRKFYRKYILKIIEEDGLSQKLENINL